MSTRRSTRKKSQTHSHVASPKPAKKQKRTGIQGTVDASAPLGVVDPEAKVQGKIVLIDNVPADAMLVLLDPAKNTDKFFVLQAIETESGDAVVYSRWGRTGTSGQALLQDFDSMEDAVKAFDAKFKQKTGLSWQERKKPYKGGKYRFIVQDFIEKQAGYTNFKWEYYVDDEVDGKPDGWYPYDSMASVKVEKLYHENVNNPSLTTRLVDSGAWTYNVDLVEMIQTNVTHSDHTSRRIRRVPNNEQPDTSVASLPTTPVKVASFVPSAVTPSPAKSNSTTTASNKTKGSHPVDPDVLVKNQNPSDFQVVCSEDGVWYDVVLNQCNVSQNNNKYYRIQLLTDGSMFYCWQKWGRVGEPARGSSSKFEGPFATLEVGLKPFLKKYRDKTGNAFGAEEFVPKKNKYTPIEIDNDVQVKEEDTKAPASNAVKVEYLPSKLDPTTKELIEVLFSQDMRNEALSTFNLDLKKLPLGVPSQQQIQLGVDILDQIKDKLGGAAIAETYDELSSRFYTAIPHSFGRARPPTIHTNEGLQSRYDMCDILSDMYSTNETVRSLEKAASTATQTLPARVDQHYDSLKADFQLVDRQTQEFQKIQTYFDETKSSTARLLNVWSVDRQNEAERFNEFSKVQNRKLLFHGTNIAVVAPIVTSGLRIMPHAGGRVGAGIYLANMQEKSAQYTSGYGSKFACMFLVEAALGKTHFIDSDGPHASSLREAPDGFDSVHAKGQISPGEWDSMNIQGNSVQLPKSKAVPNEANSSFYHDEHLVYKESQVRLRYILTVKLY